MCNQKIEEEVMDELPDKVRQIVDVHPTSPERKNTMMLDNG